MNILILLFAIFFLILAYRHLDWAVIFLIAALPSYLIRFNLFGLPATLLEAMIWLVFLVWVIANWPRIKANIIQSFKKDNNKIKIRYPFDWEIILLLIVSLVAAGVSGFSASALGIWKAYFFEPVLLFIVVLNVFGSNASVFAKASADKNTTNDTRILRIPHPTPASPAGGLSLQRRGGGVEKIILALAIGALAVSLMAIYQKITGQFIDNALWQAAATRRVVSFFGYPNAVGLYLGPILLVLLGWLVKLISEFGWFYRINPKSQILSLREISRRETNPKQIQNSPPEADPPSAEKLQIQKIIIIFVVLVIILALLSIYFAKSKGALVGVGAGLVVFGLLAGRKIRWATILAVLIAGVFVLSYAPARNLVVQTITFNSVSGQIRRAGWSDTWKMLKDGRLITGAGLANYQTAIKPYHTEGIFIKNDDPDWLRKVLFNADYRKKAWQPLEIYLYPHNIILNFWSELGLSGLLLFVWVILKYFWLGIYNLQFIISKQILPLRWISRREKNSKNKIQNTVADYKFLNIGLIGAMTVIVVHGIVDVPYFKNDLAMMFWLLVAMMSMINETNAQTNTHSADKY